MIRLGLLRWILHSLWNYGNQKGDPVVPEKPDETKIDLTLRMVHFEPGDLVQWDTPDNTWSGTVVRCYDSRYNTNFLNMNMNSGTPDICRVRIDSTRETPKRYQANVGETVRVPMDDLKRSVAGVVNRKAKNQAIRNVVEKRMGVSAIPGHGPANLIRNFAGISLTRGAQGGRKRKNKTRRARK